MRRTRRGARRATIVAGALALASCTVASPPTPTPAPTTAERAPVHQGETRLPDGPSTLLEGGTASRLAVAASEAFFVSSPVVVVTASFTFAEEALRAASIAVALGAPLLVEDEPEADPTAAPAPSEPPAGERATTEPPAGERTPAEPPTDLADEIRRLGARAVVTVGAPELELPDVAVVRAPDDDAALAELLGGALAREELADPQDAARAVARLDRDDRALLALPPGWSAPDAEAEPTPSVTPSATPSTARSATPSPPPSAELSTPSAPDPSTEPSLPRTELPDAPEGGLLLTTGVATELAAVATARAAGVDVVTVPSGDPGLLPETIDAIAGAEASSVVGVGPAFAPAERFAWKVAAAATGVELPGGGQVLFPGRRMVAMYGSPGIPALGILGEQDVAASIERVRGLAATYQPLTTDAVVPAFEIIATIADAPAGDDGNYSNELPPESFVPWVEAALEAGVYVVLDLQPGRTDFVTQARRYESLLRYPNVGLALDPEWRLAPDQVHLRQIGSVHVDEVNAVVAYLAELTRTHALPQKLLVLHQFMPRMIQGRELVTTTDPAVQVLIHVDGQGSQGGKAGTWANLQAGAPAGVVWGWKNFIDEDVPMATPEQTYLVQPTPHFVSYQ